MASAANWADDAPSRYRARMHRALWVLAAGSALACSHHHQAPVRSAQLSPPEGELVQHTNRLWIELESTDDPQCERTPSERKLCFADVREAVGGALERTLWPSFPGVAVKRKGDDVAPGDYLLHVRVRLSSRAPDAAGPGWAAHVDGSWRLVRDGLPLASESFSSRSRGDFAYGRALGEGAGEVVDAVALHVARSVGRLPELRPAANRPLPAVATRAPTGGSLRVGAETTPLTKPTAARSPRGAR